MPSIRLLTGEVMTADTYDQLYDAYRSIFMNAALTDDDFRSAIEKRAKLWSGTEINTDGSAVDFFQEVERAGLILTVSTQPLANDPKRPLEASVPRLAYLRELADKKAARLATR